MAAFDHNVAKI